ncbi:hypothetical protein [Nonomuraea dietziae]|uniref:hypothetical protein n=1 Tax=Nonomuraea dietziae TaxID=65515 RepID=UPI0031E41C5F
MNLSLSDLAPPLRWTSTLQIAPLADDPQLPEAWWQSIPLDRAVRRHRCPGRPQDALADLAVAFWGHLQLGDILPLLRFSDPRRASGRPRGSAGDVVHKLCSAASSSGCSRACRRGQGRRPLPQLVDECSSRSTSASGRSRVIASTPNSGPRSDELAQRFSVTRERIRQIERDLRRPRGGLARLGGPRGRCWRT